MDSLRDFFIGEGVPMDVKSHMKRNVISIPATATIREAARVFVKHHVGLLPVIDDDEKPVGVVSLRDLLTLELPDFVSFVADVDFVHDFGAVETTRPPAEKLRRSIKSLIRPAVSVQEDEGLLRAYALMQQHDLHDILVVSQAGRLVGIASRVDVGVAILKSWGKAAKK
jgi:CBS domain-containing protein